MNYIRIHPDDLKTLAELLADRIATNSTKPEPLLSLKQLASAINVPYSTLAKKELPFHRMSKGGRKLYRASEVMRAVRR